MPLVKMKVELFLDPEQLPMREFYFQFVRRRLVTVVQYIYPFKSHFTNMAQHQFIDIDGSVLEGVNILLTFFFLATTIVGIFFPRL